MKELKPKTFTLKFDVPRYEDNSEEELKKYGRTKLITRIHVKGYKNLLLDSIVRDAKKKPVNMNRLEKTVKEYVKFEMFDHVGMESYPVIVKPKKQKVEK